jgi:TnpA family transposase
VVLRVTFYTHISDRYAPFHTKVINTTVRDATHVLDGLLYHESDLRIEEHYTDTAGFTDHVFGLCHLLGFRFAPRIRDLADRRLYTAEKAKRFRRFSRLSEARSTSNNSWPSGQRSYGLVAPSAWAR